MKKLLSVFLILLMLSISTISVFAEENQQGEEKGEWFYTDFGFPKEYIREDLQTTKSFHEKLWLPKVPYQGQIFFELSMMASYELPDHDKNVEYFKNEAPLIMILCPSENAVQYTFPGLFSRCDGITLTQARVIEILRNENNEQINAGDLVWVQENYFWYTDGNGVDVFSSPYGAQCKPLYEGAHYLVQATRVQEATKENVFSIGQYFWETSNTDIYFEYNKLKMQWLYCSFWEIDAYKDEVFAHFGLIESEKTPSYIHFIIGGVAILTVAVTTVAVIVFTRKKARKKAPPTSD